MNKRPEWITSTNGHEMEYDRSNHKQHVAKTDSVLAHDNSIPTIKDNMVEGIDFINISIYSTTPIGQMLAPGYPLKKGIQMPFGKCGTVRSAMEYIIRDVYPKELLAKSRLSRAELTMLGKPTRRCTNYWSIVAYAIIARIKNDDELIALLTSLPSKTIFTSFNGEESVDFFGTVLVMPKVNIRMRNYLAIIRFVKEMLDNGSFNDSSIQNFIMASRHNQNVGIWDGTMIKVKEEQTELS
jgi:hypothetical protein